MRKAKRVLWLVVNVALAAYGVVITLRGTAALFSEKGPGLLLAAVGLVGVRLWLRYG